MPSAGEVEQFVYCPHNWQLARSGVEGNWEESRRGVAEHRRLGLAQKAAEKRRAITYRSLNAALVVATFAGSVTLAVLLAFDSLPLVQELGLVAVGAVLLATSAGLLTLGLIRDRQWKSTTVGGVIPAKLLVSELDEPNLMVDPTTGLAGRPDSLLETASGVVPVEIKTGRTPDRPYPSHVMQTACYLALVEAQGHSPEYGLLVYPEGVFRVAWDAKLKADLGTVLNRIQDASRTGVAHRDHEDRGRCRGCARREACTQRLE